MFIYSPPLISANVLVLPCSLSPPRGREVRITSCHVSRRQQRNREIRLEPSEELQSGPRDVDQRADSPEAGHHAAEEEHAVALDEGGQEGEEAVDGHGNQQALFTAQLVRQAAPKEGAEHHPQIHDAAWNTQIKTVKTSQENQMISRFIFNISTKYETNIV